MIRKQWFVYVLRCRDGSYYTGATNDLEKRLSQHASGKGSKYVRSRLPFKMALCERMENARDAYERERGIKALGRKEKEALVLGHPKAY